MDSSEHPDGEFLHEVKPWFNIIVASSLAGRTWCVRNGYTRREIPLRGGLIPLNLLILALAPYTGTDVSVALLDVDSMFSMEWEGGES